MVQYESWMYFIVTHLLPFTTMMCYLILGVFIMHEMLVKVEEVFGKGS